MIDAKNLVEALVDDVKDFVSDFGVQGINPEALEPLFELTVSKHIPQPATLDGLVALSASAARLLRVDARIFREEGMSAVALEREAIVDRIDALTAGMADQSG